MEKRLANLRQRLGKAVEAGKLTKEEAEEKWNVAARRAKAGGTMKKELEGVADRLKAAVKAGKITEEEAKATDATIATSGRKFAKEDVASVPCAEEVVPTMDAANAPARTSFFIVITSRRWRVMFLSMERAVHLPRDVL